MTKFIKFIKYIIINYGSFILIVSMGSTLGATAMDYLFIDRLNEFYVYIEYNLWINFDTIDRYHLKISNLELQKYHTLCNGYFGKNFIPSQPVKDKERDEKLCFRVEKLYQNI